MEVSVKNLRRSYSGKVVLDIDKLTMKKDIITGIIGPNGSGKSTLLGIISGLDKGFEGKVYYDGKTIEEKTYREMTLVFQKPYLFRRTVYENLEYPLTIRKVSKAEKEKRIESMLNRFEIQDLKNKKAHLLSGGESQKVNLARALIFNPKLLLLDEPTSNIDPESIQIMEKEIISFNQEEGGTVLIVTHNMEQAERVCDEIVALDEGKVVV